jgi:hypothetical protein
LPEAARFSVKIPAAPGRKERTADLAADSGASRPPIPG